MIVYQRSLTFAAGWFEHAQIFSVYYINIVNLDKTILALWLNTEQNELEVTRGDTWSYVAYDGITECHNTFPHIYIVVWCLGGSETPTVP